jgi:uncharacterized protein YecA (UPF0149 family)
MPHGAVGRNDPCPCGSGKKYKKCCLEKDQEALAQSLPPPLPPAPAWKPMSMAERAQIAEEIQLLDDLSNGALDQIKARRYDEAERLCERLLSEFPQVIDGHDRLGMLREAQERYQEAAEHYAKVLAMIKENPEDYGPEVAETFQRQRDEALAKANP